MGGRLVRTIAWKALLYLVVAVVLAGVTRDLMLTALLTLGFAAGDSSVAALLRAPVLRRDGTDATDATDVTGLTGGARALPPVGTPNERSTP